MHTHSTGSVHAGHHTAPHIARLAAMSVRNFAGGVYQGWLRLRHDRVGTVFDLPDIGPYRVLRETIGYDQVDGAPAVLIVEFRLRVAGTSAAMHAAFERLCTLTTPFWNGFPGFRVKLWMAQPETHNYLGIYQWAGPDNALVYAEALERVLRRVSIKASVWFTILENRKLDDYLNSLRLARHGQIEGACR